MECIASEVMRIKASAGIRNLLTSREFRVEEISSIMEDFDSVIEDIEMNGLDKDLDGFSFDYT